MEETTELWKSKFLRQFKIFAATIFGKLSKTGYFVISIFQFNFAEFGQIRHFTFISNMFEIDFFTCNDSWLCSAQNPHSGGDCTQPNRHCLSIFRFPTEITVRGPDKSRKDDYQSITATNCLCAYPHYLHACSMSPCRPRRQYSKRVPSKRPVIGAISSMIAICRYCCLFLCLRAFAHSSFAKCVCDYCKGVAIYQPYFGTITIPFTIFKR